MSTSTPRRGWLRRGVPLILLLGILLGFTGHHLWHWADLPPGPIFSIAHWGLMGAMVCLLALVVWFFAFSGLGGKVKLAGLIVLLLLVGGSIASIDGVTPDAYLIPHPHFRWQARPQDQLARYLEEQTTADGLPKIDLTIDPVNDFPRYRGLLADGVVRPSELLDVKWESGKPVERWRHPCGGGFSGFALAGNVAITVEQRGEQEAVVCYDQKTGKQRWLFEHAASFKHVTGSGPRATPTIADAEVYSLGARGDLVCLDGTTGEKKWLVNILEDNESKAVEWGMTSSPLVVDDLVIVNPGVDSDKNAGRALAAYNRKDGKRVWGAGNHRAGYSSPHLATLAGRKQVLLFDGGGLGGFDLKTGKELWRFPWETYQEMNIIQPVLCEGDRVFISSETTNGCAMLKVTRKGEAFDVQPVWANKAMAAKQANPVKIGNAIYGLHNGTLVCLGIDKGERLWRGRNYGQGQLLALAGTLLIQSERGELALVLADRERSGEIERMPVFDAPRTWNTPALAGRYLYLRNDVEMVCYELPVRD